MLRAKCKLVPPIRLYLSELEPRFVCAMSQQTSEVVHLASYRRARGGGDRLRAVKIWQAARATSAAASFFEPIVIGMGAYEEKFLDGATGANNPVQNVWNEAQALSEPKPLEQNLKTIILVGTGVPSLKPFDSALAGIGPSLVSISTDTEQTAESFQRAHWNLDEEGRYFRFNVQMGLENIGLEDASARSTVMTVTNRYVEQQDTYKAMVRCSKNISERESASMFA